MAEAGMKKITQPGSIPHSPFYANTIESNLTFLGQTIWVQKKLEPCAHDSNLSQSPRPLILPQWIGSGCKCDHVVVLLLDTDSSLHNTGAIAFQYGEEGGEEDIQQSYPDISPSMSMSLGYARGISPLHSIKYNCSIIYVPACGLMTNVILVLWYTVKSSLACVLWPLKEKNNEKSLFPDICPRYCKTFLSIQ